MYITITDIVGEKRINLDYPIWSKEVAIISMFSDNIQYKIKETLKVLLIMNEEKPMLMSREINAFVGRKVITTLLDANDHFVKMDKLAHVIEVVISLGELDSTDNLEDINLSNMLLRYQVTPHSTRNLRRESSLS